MRIPLIQGFATSAVAGSEGLVRASRSALTQWINAHRESVTELLNDMLVVLNENMQDDRYAVPIMELAAFLIDNYVSFVPEGTESRSVQPSMYLTVNIPDLLSFLLQLSETIHCHYEGAFQVFEYTSP